MLDSNFGMPMTPSPKGWIIRKVMGGGGGGVLG